MRLLQLSFLALWNVTSYRNQPEKIEPSSSPFALERKTRELPKRRIVLFTRSHDTCDLCLFDQENFKQSEKKSKNHETWSTLLNKQRKLKPPTFLLGKNQHTLKLSIHVLANREIENNQPFLLVREPKTTNYKELLIATDCSALHIVDIEYV